MSVIVAKDVSMSYEGKRVLDLVSFNVDEGDYLCIVGENGSGKTTLLKALAGLKKIDSGLLEFNDGLKRNQIGYLPQQRDFQRDFPASVWEVVLSGCIGSMGLRPFYGKKEKMLADNTLDKLEIKELKHKCYHELSGGQQQRVLLARALCASKRLLILDEPTTGLDIVSSRELYSLISTLNEDGMTIIMISHDIKSCIKYADKVLHLGEMGQLYFGSAKDYEMKGFDI